jgi:hypothetical protein
MSALRSATKFLIAGLLLSFASVTFAAREMEIPAPVQIPQGKTEKDVKEAIALAATARHWITKPAGNGVLEASVNVRNKHMLAVELKYDAKQVSMSYKNSDNLDYSMVDGKAMIHRNANSWMQLLMTDINTFLNR